MRELIWRIVAHIVSKPDTGARIVARAMHTPYRHITSADGKDTYMYRWWLFNPYDEQGRARWAWLPSIRVHWIKRADRDRHLHDHPWDARTIILNGWYVEQRGQERLYRRIGYTGRLLFGQFHRIAYVPYEGVWTLFFTWKKQGTWGFLVDGKKVPYKEYLKL